MNNLMQQNILATVRSLLPFNLDCYADWRTAYIWLSQQTEVNEDQVTARDMLRQLMADYVTRRHADE